MNRHRHVRGTRLRPFGLALRAPSAARPLPRRCLTGRAEELRASPCAPFGLASDFHRIERFKKREQLRGSASRIIRKTAERRQYVWKRRKLQTKARQARCRAIGHGQPSENPRITLPPCTQRSANLQAKVKSAVLVGKRAAPDDNTKRADHANHSGIFLGGLLGNEYRVTHGRPSEPTRPAHSSPAARARPPQSERPQPVLYSQQSRQTTIASRWTLRTHRQRLDHRACLRRAKSRPETKRSAPLRDRFSLRNPQPRAAAARAAARVCCSLRSRVFRLT